MPYKFTCTCAAGQALCHHAVAVVYQIQHYQKLGLTVVPPIVSQTSLPQVCSVCCQFAIGFVWLMAWHGTLIYVKNYPAELFFSPYSTGLYFVTGWTLVLLY